MNNNCCCNKIKVNTEPAPRICVAGQTVPNICITAAERGEAGKDATINGVNTLTVNTEGVIASTQVGDVFTIKSTSYVHNQGEASDTWIVHHNLDKYPSVTVVDSSGSQVIASVEYNDSNSLTIRMSASFKGKAFLN